MTSELDRLERRTQEVRGQLALDLDELFVRLQPRRMVRSIAVYTQDTQLGSGLGREIVRDMRQKPIPYLLIGMGIAGLVWAMTSFSRSRTRARLPEFDEADFVPPPSPRVAAATVRAASVTSTSAASPVSAPSTGPARELSPVTSEEP